MSLELRITGPNGEFYSKEVNETNQLDKKTVYDYIFNMLNLNDELCSTGKHSDFLLLNQPNIDWNHYINEIIRENTIEFIEIFLKTPFKQSQSNSETNHIVEAETVATSCSRNSSNQDDNQNYNEDSSSEQPSQNPEVPCEDDFLNMKELKRTVNDCHSLLLPIHYNITSDDPCQKQRDEKELPNFLKHRREFNDKLLLEIRNPQKKMSDGTVLPRYPNEGAPMDQYRNSMNGFDIEIPREFIAEVEREVGFVSYADRKMELAPFLSLYQEYARENESRKYDGRFTIWQYDPKAVCVSPLYGTEPKHFKIRYREVPNGEKFFYCTREGNRYTSILATINAYVTNRIRLYLKSQRQPDSNDHHPLFLTEQIPLQKEFGIPRPPAPIKQNLDEDEKSKELF